MQRLCDSLATLNRRGVDAALHEADKLNRVVGLLGQLFLCQPLLLAEGGNPQS